MNYLEAVVALPIDPTVAPSGPGPRPPTTSNINSRTSRTHLPMAEAYTFPEIRMY